jgi:hypothetical protein
MPNEALAVELKRDGYDHAGLAGRALPVVGLRDDAGVLEHRAVELGGLLSLGVEPQVRDDLLVHQCLLSGSGAPVGGMGFGCGVHRMKRLPAGPRLIAGNAISSTPGSSLLEYIPER